MTWEIWLLCSTVVALITNADACHEGTPDEQVAAQIVATGGILLGPVTLALLGAIIVVRLCKRDFGH